MVMDGEFQFLYVRAFKRPPPPQYRLSGDLRVKLWLRFAKKKEKMKRKETKCVYMGYIFYPDFVPECETSNCCTDGSILLIFFFIQGKT